MNDKELEILKAEDEPSQLTVVNANSTLSLQSTLGVALKQAWQPIPVAPPEVDPNLPLLPAIQRSSEVLRYKILQLEYTISPEGGLRGWLRFNVLVSILLAIPALFLVPVITFILSSFATLTGFILQAAINILYTLLVIVAIGALIMIIGFAVTQLRLRQIHNEQQTRNAHQNVRGSRRSRH
jgi:hypothetical protein